MNKKLNILLITGVVTDEHDPKMVPMIRFLLESTGRFNVRINEDFTGASAETLNNYDAVFVDYDGRVDFESPFIGWGINAEKALYDYVQNGGGAVMYHSSIIKGNPAMPENFVRLVGCDFDFAAGARKSPKIELIVDVDTEAHEITHGSAKSWMSAQEDFFLNMKWLPDVPVTVLATVRDDMADYELDKIQPHRRYEFESRDLANLPGMSSSQPVAWTHNYGKGRVLSISIGHGPDTLKRPNFVGLLCRGTEWVASGETTIPYPDLTGLNRRRAWPYYLDMTVTDYGRITSF